MALNINQTQLDSYNKSTNNGKGTLIANWHEESILRGETGEGRIKNKEHITKNHQDLFLLAPNEIKTAPSSFSSSQRIFGSNGYDFKQSNNKIYGSTQNPCDAIPKVGRRHQMIEQQFLQSIGTELDQKSKIELQQQQTQVFSTTNRIEYTQKNTFEAGNMVGRRVMRTQDGKYIEQPEYYQMTNKNEEQEPQSYLSAAPITFYTDKLGQGTAYGSAPIDPARPFHKVDQFAKTFHHFTHIKQ